MSLENSIIVESSGRINLIGEHVDYNGGYVLPASIDKKIILRLSIKSGEICFIKSQTLKKSFKINLKEFSKSKTHWENYIIGVINNLVFTKKFKIKAFNCEIISDLPIGAGVSSSSSLICGLTSGLNYLNNLKLNSNEIIDIVSDVENNFIGLKGGIMDQFAIVNGKKNKLLLLNCQDRSFKLIKSRFSPYEIVLINTNIKHNLIDSSYNSRVQECKKALKIINKVYGKYNYLVDIDEIILNKFKNKLSNKVFKRALFVIQENKRTINSSKKINESKIKDFGKLMYESHFGLKNLYEVSCKELDFLVDFTKDFEEVVGSRMMGGGFGGCTINLIKTNFVNDFIKLISKAYLNKFNLRLEAIPVKIEEGITIKKIFS